MNYLDLGKEAKKTAVSEYCSIMDIKEKDWFDVARNRCKIKYWLETQNLDLYNIEGKLKHKN